MIFLPIVFRELRVAARRSSTYWIRTVAGLLMVTAGASLVLILQSEPPRAASLYLFITLTSIAVVYALLSGVRSTADCLSEERREGTLGLLFLTDLKGYDVVLGKLVANSLSALYAVLAVLPTLAIPLLMGGITLGEFGRMALVALNALFFSLALGMAVSSLSRSAQRAAWATALLIAGLTAAVPVYAAFGALAGTRTGQLYLLFPSTGFTYYRALDVIYRTGAAPFWCSLAVVNALGWSALVFASAVVPHNWQDRPAGIRRVRWAERIQALSLGSFAERRAFRSRLLDENPFFWLVARARGKPMAVWAFLALVGGVWAWGLAKYRREWLNEGMYFGTALIVNFVLRCWFASEAARQLAQERKNGSLEVLLCTPLSVQTIVRGQQLGLLRQFLWPTVVTLALELIFMKATAADAELSQSGTWYLLYGGIMIMLVADLVAMAWVGMWQGLSAKNHALAVNAVVGRILVWPWAGFVLVLTALSVSSAVSSNQSERTWVVLFAGWFLSGITADVVFAARSRSRLLNEFRLEAQKTRTRPDSWWSRLRK